MKKLHLISLTISIASCFTIAAQPRRDSTFTIKESIVSASRKTRLPKTGTGSMEIPAEMIRDTPSLLGEPDLIKTIQLLPGVKAGTEGLSGIYVRGGGPDENLILLDGIPLCSSGHMLGLFSVFQDEAVDNAVLHKGAFPAGLGGRASGIIDVKTLDGNPDRLNGSLGVGLLTDSFHLDGPLAKGRTTFSVSGRGMHTLLMEGAFRVFKVPANYYFHDLHAKMTHRAGPDDRISASVFRGTDRLRNKEDRERTDMSWGNKAESVSWTKNWSDNIRSEVTVGRGYYRMGIRQKTVDNQVDGYHSGLEDLVVKACLVDQSADGHGFSSGAELTRHLFSPGMDGDSTVNEKFRIRGYEAAIHADDIFKVGDGISVEAGLRMTLFNSQGFTAISPEPRFSVTIQPRTVLEAKASYSRMSQYIHLLSPSMTTLPIDIWVPVTKKTRPVYSDLFTAGLGMNWPSGWGIDVECYWKSLKNVLEYKDGVMFVDDFGTWEEQTSTGKGRSYGIELLIRKGSGKTTGWIGYTLSKSERRFPDGSIGSGKWFPCRYDCRNDISVVLNRRIGKRWDAGLTWTYTDGGAITVPGKDGSTHLRGNVRLPPSHRLDLGLKHSKATGPSTGSGTGEKGQKIWNIGIYNAYNRKNPNIVFPVSDEEDGGPGSLKIVSILPIIPSVSYTRVF